MHIKDHVYLDYSDVLLVPKRSALESRSQVSLERTFNFLHSNRKWSGIPILAANMDTTGTFEMVYGLAPNKVITALHKHYSIEELVSFYVDLPEDFCDFVFFSIGMREEDLEKMDSVFSALKTVEMDSKLYQVNIDVPNGYIEKFAEFVQKVRTKFPTFTISAGNVATANMTEQLILSGADIVKIGLGSGSACETRLRTGVGIPQLSAVMECADAAHGLGGHVIGDGGLVHVGDFAKGFCAGADFLMAGSFFAGHDESNGQIVLKDDGKKYIEFYGMSSRKANEAYSGGLRTYRASEGRELLIPYKGPVSETIQEILGGLRSTGTYIGAAKLKDFGKCATFIRVSNQVNRSLEKYTE